MALKSRTSDTPYYNDFTKYKKHLRTDFDYTCVYCTLHENEIGGPRAYGVEHLKPKEKFPDHECSYSNLLYACNVCNSFKGEDWPSDNPITDGKGYIDPCHHDYDDHFGVTDDFGIVGKTDVGNYMAKRMRLRRKQVSKKLRLRLTSEQQHHAKISAANRIIASLRGVIERYATNDPEPEEVSASIRDMAEQIRAWEEEWDRRWFPQLDLDDYR